MTPSRIRQELFDLCTGKTQDIETLLEALVDWIRNNPDKTDQP